MLREPRRWRSAVMTAPVGRPTIQRVPSPLVFMRAFSTGYFRMPASAIDASDRPAVRRRVSGDIKQTDERRLVSHRKNRAKTRAREGRKTVRDINGVTKRRRAGGKSAQQKLSEISESLRKFGDRVDFCLV